MKNRFSLLAFLLGAIIILGVTLAKPRFLMKNTEATLAWDVSGYYLYLPAIFIYKDLKELKFLPGILEKYQPSFAPDQAFPIADGTLVMKYPAGMAVLYLPFFLLAHLLAGALGYPADGFSMPYQACIHLGSVLAALAGLWFLRKNLLHFFSDRTAGIVILLLALGTNFFNYATFDAALPHVWLFTLLALLVHFTIKWHSPPRHLGERPTWRSSLGIGFCIGMAALVRPTEVIFALVPLLWWRSDLTIFKKITSPTLQPKLLAAALLAGAIGFIQLAYWKFVSGDWLVYSYQNQGFSFLHPHFADVLFSYRKGWFVYTPLMLFAVAGFVFLAKNHRHLLLPVLAFFLVNLWIVSAWDIWWYGGAFGQRAMVQSYVLLAFPLAALVEWLAGRKNLERAVFAGKFRRNFPAKTALSVLAFVAFFGCVALNLFQTYQAHWGPFETEAMTKAYFWRIFGETKNDPYDRLLLDTNEGFFGERKNVTSLLSIDFEAFADPTGVSRKVARSGKFSWFVDPTHPFSPPVNLPKTPETAPDSYRDGKWLHVSGWFYSPQLEYEAWWMPQLVVRFEKGGQAVVKERCIRPFRVMQPNQWQEVGMDIRIPKKDFDTVKIFLWNVRDRVPMFMDDLEVTAFE